MLHQGTENVDYYLERKNNSSKIVIVFSHFLINPSPKSPFAFREFFEKLDVNCLYVRDSGNNWYNRSILGLGAAFPETADRLGELIADNGFSAVDCLGASMGGYGALLFGAHLRARNVLAFSPQTFLSPPYPRYDKSYHIGEYVDLKNFDINSRIEKIKILISEDELFDVYSLIRLPYWNEMNITYLRNSSHLVPRTLSNLGILEDVLRNFCADGDLNLPDTIKGNVDIAGIQQSISQAVEAYYGQCWQNSLLNLDTALSANPHWAGGHLWAARACKALAQEADAIRHLEIASLLNPMQYETIIELAWQYMAQQEFAKAIEHADQARRLNHNLTGQRNLIIEKALDHIESADGRNSHTMSLLSSLAERLPALLPLPDHLLSRIEKTRGRYLRSRSGWRKLFRWFKTE